MAITGKCLSCITWDWTQHPTVQCKHRLAPVV
jgi:hypothetical protein